MARDEFIVKFLSKELNKEEFNKLKRELQKILKAVLERLPVESSFYKLEYYFTKYYGNDYLEVLTQEFLYQILANKKRFLSLNYVSKKYLEVCAKNLIFNLLSKEVSGITQELNYQDLIFSESDPEDSQQEARIEEVIGPKVLINYLDKLSLETFVTVVRKELSKEELETLCLYLEGIFSEKRALEKREKNLYYKRWERLKPKLRKLFENYFEEFNGASREVFFILMSELCKKGS